MFKTDWSFQTLVEAEFKDSMQPPSTLNLFPPTYLHTLTDSPRVPDGLANPHLVMSDFIVLENFVHSWQNIAKEEKSPRSQATQLFKRILSSVSEARGITEDDEKRADKYGDAALLCGDLMQLLQENNCFDKHKDEELTDFLSDFRKKLVVTTQINLGFSYVRKKENHDPERPMGKILDAYLLWMSALDAYYDYFSIEALDWLYFVAKTELDPATFKELKINIENISLEMSVLRSCCGFILWKIGNERKTRSNWPKEEAKLNSMISDLDDAEEMTAQEAEAYERVMKRLSA
ncbi:MAG: hypothetical protein WA902_24840 [Thermosynechococcaceae cyanobacterium]